MGNKNSTSEEINVSNPKFIGLTRKNIAMWIMGYARIHFKHAIIPTEIIYLCCKYYEYRIKTLTLPILSNTQYAVCSGHFNNITCISYHDTVLISRSGYQGKSIFWRIPKPTTNNNLFRKKRKIVHKLLHFPMSSLLMSKMRMRR